MRSALLLSMTLLLASPAAHAWEVRINGGRPIVLTPGSSSEFEIAVTRAADDPTHFFGSSIFQLDEGSPPLPFYLLQGSGGRCGVYSLDFLLPPGYVNGFQVTPVAAGETVRCRIGIVALPDAEPGSYPLILYESQEGLRFDVLIQAPVAATIVPAGTPPAWLALALLVLLAARRAR
jgi:hypothetical protein